MTDATNERTARSSRIGSPFVISFAVAFPTLVTWLYFVVLAGRPTYWQQSAVLIGKSIQFAIPLVWVWLVQKPIRRDTRSFSSVWWHATVFGIAAVAGMLVAYHVWLKPSSIFETAGDTIRAKVQQLGILSTTAYLGLGIFYAVVHSGLEEYYWRWFVFGELESILSLKAAMVISSLGFTAHHVILLATCFGWDSPLTYLGSFSVALGGAYWAWLYYVSGTIYRSWLSHLLVDAGIFLVGFDIVKSTF